MSQSKASFIEAAFVKLAHKQSNGSWQDKSTSSSFIFESDFGFLRLHKRLSFPQTFAYIDGDVLYFGYGDPQKGKDATRHSLQKTPESCFYGAEFLFASADLAKGKLTIQRDASSTLPLVVSMNSERLLISNRYERVLELCEPKSLHANKPVIAKAIMGGYTGGQMIFGELEAIYDRQRLTWTTDTCGIDFPPNGSVVTVAKDRNGKPQDFRKQLEKTLDTYWSRYSPDDTTIGAELSCGLDTSMMDGYLALKKRPLFMVSSIYDGVFKESVQLKIRDFAERFKVRIHKLYMLSDTEYPLSSMVESGAWRPFYHSQELYMESIGKMAKLLAQNNITTVFRGIGGDELCDNIPDYSRLIGKSDLARHLQPESPTPPWLTDDFKRFCKQYLLHETEQPRPIPLLSMSVAASSIVGNNMYIDEGIWPVSPLADPELFLFCQSLPIECRVNKNIFRAYLEVRQFPESIYTWPNENFNDFFDRSVGTHLQAHFSAVMEHSALAKAGWIDVEAAKNAWRTIAGTKVSDDDDTLFWLFCILSVEINLQLAGVELG